MFCPKCGSQLPDGASFCGNCGSHIAAAPTQQAGQYQAPQQAGQYQSTQQPAAYGSPRPAAAAGGGIDPKLLSYARLAFAALVAILLVVPWFSVTALDSLVSLSNESISQTISPYLADDSTSQLIPSPGSVNLSVPGVGDVLSFLSQGVGWAKDLATSGASVLGSSASQIQLMASMIPDIPTVPYALLVILWFAALVLAVVNGTQMVMGRGSAVLSYAGFGIAALVALAFIIAAGAINGTIADAVRLALGSQVGSTAENVMFESFLSRGFVGTTPAPIVVLVASLLGIVATFLGQRGGAQARS